MSTKSTQLPFKMKAAWEYKVEKCQNIRHNSMNPEWLIPVDKLPPNEQLNVIDFPETCGLLTSKEVEITRMTAVDLVDQMGKGKLSAVEVATAFLKRAHVGNQLLNFATEFMIEDALTRAAELDTMFKKNGKLVGPLHGVPVSVKEHIGLKDRICHSSYVAWMDNIPEEDALLVRLMKAAGAVFIVRTNQPQSLMHLECSNVIYGETVNPYNRNLTSGGSSGGEGASIGIRAAAIGLGTDIGGSIRCPAAFCGVYGLRTTALRNPYKGIFLAGDGQESIRCVVGPLANSLADLQLFQKAVIDQKPWEEETSLVPLPWKQLSPFKSKEISWNHVGGWLDRICYPFPPIIRALKHAEAKLKAAGVRVVNFEPYEHARGWEILRCLYFPDAAEFQKDLLEKGGEPIHPLTDYHRTMKERGVDFILCPAYTGVASEIGTAQYWRYTAIWNILDQPAVIFPTGLTMDPNVDVLDPNYKLRNAEERREYKKYTPQNFKDAPIALQVVGKHFEDEATLEATQLISKIVQGK